MNELEFNQQLITVAEQSVGLEKAIQLAVAISFEPEKLQPVFAAIEASPQEANGEILLKLIELLLPLILKLFGL